MNKNKVLRGHLLKRIKIRMQMMTLINGRYKHRIECENISILVRL